MIRIDTAIPAGDEGLRNPANERTVPAVAATRAPRDGGDDAHTDERLADMKAAAGKLADMGRPRGVHVDLSGAGKAMALGGPRAESANRNADIDDADLPDQIKDLLKRIRQIREELRQKQAELREAMADTKMRPDQRKMKVAMLQAEVMALTSALMLASNALSKLITELKLSSEQAMVAGQLIMA